MIENQNLTESDVLRLLYPESKDLAQITAIQARLYPCLNILDELIANRDGDRADRYGVALTCIQSALNALRQNT